MMNHMDLCRPDEKYIGLCNTHASVMRGDECEAVKIQRVREIQPVFPPDNSPPWVHGEARGWNKAISEVDRALDGDR